MGKKRERIDTSAERQSLTDNPFAQLAGAGESLPSGPAPDTAKPAPTAPATPYRIQKSRKGNYQLAIERRAAGKTVTVLRGVSGDAAALLAALKKACGTGGALHEDAVELQGDQRSRIETFLKAKSL